MRPLAGIGRGFVSGGAARAQLPRNGEGHKDLAGGKAWYNRAWAAFKDAWKGLLACMGFNRADLSKIDRMDNDEFLDFLDRMMAEGKTLGTLEKGGASGTRNYEKDSFGYVDTSKGYAVADLVKDRPYLKENDQAKSGALSIPGTAGGSRLDARSVTAVLKSLGGIGMSNRPAEVNGVFDSVRDAVTYDDNGEVIPLSKRFNPASADIRFAHSPAAPRASRSHFGRTKFARDAGFSTSLRDAGAPP